MTKFVNDFRALALRMQHYRKMSLLSVMIVAALHAIPITLNNEYDSEVDHTNTLKTSNSSTEEEDLVKKIIELEQEVKEVKKERTQLEQEVEELKNERTRSRRSLGSFLFHNEECGQIPEVSYFYSLNIFQFVFPSFETELL